MLRILVGKTAAVLGLLSVAAAWFYGNSGAVAGDSFIREFYTWIGIGFMAGGAASVWKNRRYLKDEAALKKRRVEECDERNRLLGLRSWAYSGYAMSSSCIWDFWPVDFLTGRSCMYWPLSLAAQAGLLLVFRLALGRVM